ncbi:hypothetical protein QM012_008399 [Aureobasidium pullulans]|uniref:Uncharacterized protein n=1 Tax=Aureobasidium pullulans TaxID=5580 RepID=A0ABR0TK64_AURPU
MDDLEEEQCETTEAAPILLSIGDAVRDPGWTSGYLNATSATETSVDDDMAEAAASLLLLSTHPVVNGGDQVASDSSSTHSGQHGDTPAQNLSASAAPDFIHNTLDAAFDAASDTRDTTSALMSDNAHWAELTADQQAIQERRLDMTAWQRYQHNLQAYDHVDAQGSVIGRLWQTTTERRTFRQSQRRRGATLLRAATTRDRSFSKRHSNNQK